MPQESPGDDFSTISPEACFPWFFPIHSTVKLLHFGWSLPSSLAAGALKKWKLRSEGFPACVIRSKTTTKSETNGIQTQRVTEGTHRSLSVLHQQRLRAQRGPQGRYLRVMSQPGSGSWQVCWCPLPGACRPRWACVRLSLDCGRTGSPSRKPVGRGSSCPDLHLKQAVLSCQRCCWGSLTVGSVSENKGEFALIHSHSLT